MIEITYLSKYLSKFVVFDNSIILKNTTDFR